MKVKVTDRDRGLSYVKRRAAQLANGVTFGVGVPENAGSYPSGAAVADVALAHEFGVGVPQRSFIRGWYDGKGDGFFGQKLAKMAQDSVMRGVPIETLVAQFGEKAVQEIRERMDAGIAPSLQDDTVERKRRKGSATPETPLEDTHLLRSKITYTVKVGKK